MAIPSQSKPTNTSPLSSKWKQKKALEIMKKILKKKGSNAKQKAKTVSFDLPRNVILSYDAKSSSLSQTPDSQTKSAAIERATELQATLPSVLPSFVKPMLPSHVTGGFWLGLPRKFCGAYLPKHDQTFVLVDEEKQESNAKFLFEKIGLSGGWRGFSIAHKLLEGDALVFQLIDHWKFRVYIVRVNGLNEIDGALGRSNFVPCSINVCQRKAEKGSSSQQKAENMDIDFHQEDVQEKGLVVVDLSEDDNESEYDDSPVSEGLRFPQSALQFKDIKDMDDFSIVVDGLVIDSEIPKHFKIKYYDLCHSQKTYLHGNLLKGLNVKLAVGIILETITISDAIRTCKVTITRADFETWDKTLKAFEEFGMKVGFLRARISKLVGILVESNELLEAKRNEQMKAEEDMRVFNKKLCGLKDAIKNLDLEIQTLKLKARKLEPVFHKEANAPW